MYHFGRPDSMQFRYLRYDTNGDGDISLEEFLGATAGFTKMDPKTLYGRLDKNGNKITQFEISLFLGFLL